MAVDIMPKHQEVLEKLTGLDKKIDSINKHVSSIDKKVNQLQEKVTTLEISLNANVKTVNEVENGMNSVNADVEELKKKRDKLSKEVNALRRQQWYLETYQRRENLRFYGILEELEGKEISRNVLLNFFVSEQKIKDAGKIEFQKVHRIGKFIPSQKRPRAIIARFLRYRDREEVFSQAKLLKGKGMGISADLPKGVVDIRKKQIDNLKQAKKEGKITFF